MVIKGIAGDLKSIKKLRNGALLAKAEKPHYVKSLPQITKSGDLEDKVAPTQGVVWWTMT